MYDVIIVGAGVNGACVARELSKYELKILVIEKNGDVGDGTSCANSAIIHAGYDPHPGTLKAELNVLGNEMYEELCKDLDVEFKRNGSLTIATNSEEENILKELADNAKLNNVNVELISKEELFSIEPFATKKATLALFAKSAAIINPFELCVALMENAMDNGVELKLNEKVIDIKEYDNGYIVKTEYDEYNAKVVINCAGVNSDEVNNFINKEQMEILPRKGEYYLLDHFPEGYVTHTLFSVPSSKGKGVLVAPTTSGNYLIGPSSDFVLEKDDISTNKDTLDNILKEAYRLVDNVPMQHLIREFAGLRAYHKSNDFIIEEAKHNFINVAGMQSPGLSSAPAVAVKVKDILSKNIELKEKDDFIKTRRPLYRLKEKKVEERDKLIKENPLLGKIICRCEQISEGEIVDCIKRNCGATTVKGVKKRVRPGYGKCQGSYCQTLVLKILARELGKDMKDINFKNKGSYILCATSKGEENE